ncbi:hypothetical protein D3C87_2067420 [compost metagenome]
MLSEPISMKKLMVSPVRRPVISVGDAPGRMTLTKIVSLPAFIDFADRSSSGSTF